MDGEAFRGAIARSKQDLKGLVKVLRSVGQLQALSVSQLEVLAEAMQPVSMRLSLSLYVPYCQRWCETKGVGASDHAAELPFETSGAATGAHGGRAPSAQVNPCS